MQSFQAALRKAPRTRLRSTTGERDLLDVLVQGLPDGWTIFVRPHLDGDRPALALLHPERGAMVWDVRELDVAGLQGSPKAYHDSAGVPYLDPVEKINSIRQRLYSEYLPGWAEAIDEDSHRFGIVRAGIYFPNSQLADLARLGLTRQHEVIIGRGGLRERAIEFARPECSSARRHGGRLVRSPAPAVLRVSPA